MPRLAGVGILVGMTSFDRLRPVRFSLLVCLGLLLVGVGAALAFARTKPTPIGTGVVVIDTNLGYQSAAAAGTGMVLTSTGVVLTNNHVISGATTVKVVVPRTGRSYKARVLGYDKKDDVALIKLQGASNLRTISTDDASKLHVGDKVTAVGNAGGTGRLISARGAVTGLGKTITASDGDGSDAERLTGLIETNAGIQAGDSGGALLDGAGRVVGMNTAASSSSDSPFAAATEPDGYAIPIGKALAIATKIESGNASATVHIGGTAFLGVEVQAVSSDPYGYGYDVPATSGALVADVVSGGPAARAGLEAGDVITAIDGRTVSSPAGVTAVVLTKKPGATITVSYVDQNGTSGTARVKLGSGPAQ